jgi:serine protease inhibitor
VRVNCKSIFNVALFVALLWAIVDVRAAARLANAAGGPPTAAVIEAGNAFGFRLLRTLAAEPGAVNVMVSPLSVSLALTMTYNGARGATKTAMARTLGIGSMSGQPGQCFKSPVARCPAQDRWQ